MVFLFRELLDRKAVGWLQLIDDHGRRHEVALKAGTPCALVSDLSVEPLERSLVRLGLLTRPQLRRLGLANVSEEEAGRHLLEQGILTTKTLLRAQQYRLMLRLERLFSLGKETRYAVRRGARLPANAPGCNALALLMRGFRRLGRSERATDVLAHIGTEPVSLRDGVAVRRLGLTRIERAVVERLDEGPATVAELESLGPVPVVRTAIYALAELRFLDVVCDQEHPVQAREHAGDAVKRARERALVAAPVYTRKQLRARLAAMERQTYFDMLGVSLDATFEQVRAAHLGLLYIWHPDRLPPSLMDARQEVVKICSRLAEACRVLTDHHRRADYVASLRAQRDQVELDECTQNLLARAESAFRERRYDHAEELLVKLCALDRDHLQARALIAWLKAERIPRPKLLPGHKSNVYAHPLAILDEVIRCDPSIERARYWRGVLLKRAGFVHEAYTEFRAVLRLNPHNLGAVREVRNFEMRRRRPTQK